MKVGGTAKDPKFIFPAGFLDFNDDVTGRISTSLVFDVKWKTAANRFLAVSQMLET